MFRLFGFSAVLLVVLASSVAAQTPSTNSSLAMDKSAANDAYQKEDWGAAAERYERIVKVEDKNAGARYRLGVSLLHLDRAKEAERHLETAMAISPNAVFSLALARAYARTGNKEKMYEVLEKSIPLGGIQAASLNNEKDFASVKTEQKFIESVAKLNAAANPCTAKPEFRQLDFWIGEWDAKNAAGVTVGSSTIELILGSCVIFENWTTPVSSGKSFSNFNTSDGKWHQTWVTDKGGLTYYVGEFVDGKIVLDSETTVNGKQSVARMTFSRLPNGDVRQHGESSTDGKKTWTTTFDFTYVRKK
jgi:hypothetical protein